MKIFQWLLGPVLVAFICFTSTQAESDSDSNESGNGGTKENKNASPSMNMAQPYGYPYNHPVYMPQNPPTPYGGYNLPPLPYHYGYTPTLQQVAPLQPGYGNYPYGGYNQLQVPGASAQEPQYLSGIPGGSSIINHSLKVNKEYKEAGHHYKADSSSTD